MATSTHQGVEERVGSSTRPPWQKTHCWVMEHTSATAAWDLNAWRECLHRWRVRNILNTARCEGFLQFVKAAARTEPIFHWGYYLFYRNSTLLITGATPQVKTTTVLEYDHGADYFTTIFAYFSTDWNTYWSLQHYAINIRRNVITSLPCSNTAWHIKLN